MGNSIDICLCVDKTNSMNSFIERFKIEAPELFHDVMNIIQSKGKRSTVFACG